MVWMLPFNKLTKYLSFVHWILMDEVPPENELNSAAVAEGLRISYG
jgi:hypothetical protein